MRSFATTVIASALAFAAIFLPVSQTTATTTEEHKPTVLIGTGGVMWDYVNEDDTPVLFDLSNSMHVGSISVKSVHPTTCPADGWLTLGAGERANDMFTEDGQCRILEEPVNGKVPHWENYVESAQNSPYSPQLGQLAELMADRDTLAVGPGAALALADVDGHVENYASNLSAIGSQDLIIIDLGSITENEKTLFTAPSVRPTADPWEASFVQQDWDEEHIRESMRELDARLAQVLHELEDIDPTILLVSLADYSATASTLQLVMKTGDGPGILTSSTTRRGGLVTITDLLPTLTEHSSGPGAPISMIRTGSYESNRVAATEHEELNLAIRPSTGPAYGLWGVAWLLTLAGTLVFKRARPVHLAVLAVASFPASTVIINLFPWHTTSNPTLTLLVGTTLLSVALGVLALRLGRGLPTVPAAIVAGTNLVAFLGPVLVGSTLALDSVFGALPQVGRFYGMTNMMFAITGASALILAGVIIQRVKRRSRAALVVLLLGAIVIFVDGSPWHGTDFGGPPVLVIAFLFLAWLASGRKLSWKTLIASIIAAGAVSALFLTIDYLRPVQKRTHLGNFAESLLHGEGLDVIGRKGMQVLQQWPFALLLIAAFTAVWLLWRQYGPTLNLRQFVDPEGNPWSWIIIATVIVLVGGMALNDSGVIIIITGGMVAIALLASVLYFDRQSHVVDTDRHTMETAGPDA